MYEKIVKLCKEKGINIYNLESTLGYANGTIRKWKKIPLAWTNSRPLLIFRGDG